MPVGHLGILPALVHSEVTNREEKEFPKYNTTKCNTIDFGRTNEIL